MFEGEAEGNAVVVAQMLAARGIEASVRTVQRAVADHRRELHAADIATIRFETAPGRQMQIDLGERRVWIAGQQVPVHFMTAVLSYSRRLFVKAFLHERQGEWLDGIASAFRHFGGVPLEVLGDNARCIVVGRNRDAQTVTFHPAYAAFSRAHTRSRLESGGQVSGRDRNRGDVRIRYQIRGTVDGLLGSGLVLASDGEPDLTVSASATTFVFANPLVNGATYDVRVVTQPSGPRPAPSRTHPAR